MTSLKTFFGNQPLHTITVGQIQDYMSWHDVRRPKQISPVKEVTLRHDLHALSPLFEYGSNHNGVDKPYQQMKVPMMQTPNGCMC